MKRYVLADDLTGALEVGASFRQQGHEVVVPLRSEITTGAEVLEIVSTETRNADPATAGERVRAVLRERRDRGQTLLFKKVDSTLRGPLAAELLAVLEVAQPPLIILCPANPSVGRTVVNSVLRVHGVPLAETDFRHDPTWPAHESHLGSLLAPHFSRVAQLTLSELRGIGGESFIRSELAVGTRVLVSDAETADDLARLTSIVRETCPEAVLVGANGLAQALAQPRSVDVTTNPPKKLSSLLIVCGSRHPVSHRQIDQAAKELSAAIVTLTPDTTIKDALTEVRAAFARTSIVALRQDPTADIDSASLLYQLASIVAADRPREGTFFTGGETAFAACRALDGQHLHIQFAWENAVVAAHLHFAHGVPPRFVLSKPGGYGDDAMLVRLLRDLMK